MSRSILSGLIIILAILAVLASYAYYYGGIENPVHNAKSSETETGSELSISAILLTKSIHGEASLVGFIMISNIGDEEITIERIIVKEVEIASGESQIVINDLVMNSSALPCKVQPRESISIEAYAHIPGTPQEYYYGTPSSYESILGSRITSATLIIETSDGNYTVRYIPTPTPQGGWEETPPMNMLQIQDAIFIKTVYPDGEHINVTLQYAVKNIGPNRIELLSIRVPELDLEVPVGIRINPGQVFSDTVSVLQDYTYTPIWETGTEHLVVFVYRVWGGSGNQTVAIKAIVQ